MFENRRSKKEKKSVFKIKFLAFLFTFSAEQQQLPCVMRVAVWGCVAKGQSTVIRLFIQELPPYPDDLPCFRRQANEGPLLIILIINTKCCMNNKN